MYITYLLGLFLLFGVDGGLSIGIISQKDENVHFRGAPDEKFGHSGTNLALNSRQLDDLEKSLNVLYKKFFGPPKVKLSLRSNGDGNSNLTTTIYSIGEKICTHIKNVFKKFGINISSQADSLNLKFSDTNSLRLSLYYNLMKIPLEMKSIWQEITSKMSKQVEKNNYANLGYKTSTFSLKNYEDNSGRELKILRSLKAIEKYSAYLYSCLENSENSSFDLKRAFGKLTNYRPEVTRKILKKRLEKPLLKIPNIREDEYDQMYALICHATSENSHDDYWNCLNEVKRIDECARSEHFSQRGSHFNIGEPQEISYRSIKALDESCRNVSGKIGFSIECGRKKNMAKIDDYSYIMNFLLGDLKKSPALRNVADDLRMSLRLSRMGAETLHEIATLVGIYEKGIERKEKLVKMAQKDGAQRVRYNKMMDNLSNYERGLAGIFFKSVSSVNEVVTNVEKVFVDSGLKASNQDLSGNVRVLKCLSDVMDSIFGVLFNRPQEFPPKPETHRPENGTRNTVGRSGYPGSNGLIIVPNVVGFVRNSQSEPLKKFIGSLKRLGQASPPRRTSALISLANTFLLATMFYECISVLAAVIYREESGSVSHNTSMEDEYNEHWSSRNRRSPFFNDHQDQINENVDELESLSMTIETSKLFSTFHNKQTSQNGGNFYGFKMMENFFVKKSKSSKKKII